MTDLEKHIGRYDFEEALKTLTEVVQVLDELLEGDQNDWYQENRYGFGCGRHPGKH